MNNNMVELLWVGDAVSQTGFARVTHGVLDPLYMRGDYNIHVLGVNYNGDPHSYPYKIYPARLGGDLLGYNRLQRLVDHIKPDIIVLFNDIWVILNYLSILGDTDYDGPVVAYFPVDSGGYDPEWITPLHELSRVFVYTDFATKVLKEAGYSEQAYVIPHGIDTGIYYPMDKNEARNGLNGLNEDDFIVLNANRNQPRKRIDVTIKGFCKFAADKPDARLYLHMGIVDSGWNILGLMGRECRKNGIYNIEERLILTHPDLSPATSVSEEHLNMIYNSADVGLNTSLGEGWGLVPFEHAACKVPQIVTGYAAGIELFKDKGLLLPVRQYISALKVNTEGGLVHEDDVADALNTYYWDKELREKHASGMYDYIMQDKFRWGNIASIWDRHLKELV